MDGGRLVKYMKGISPVAVAFSGGVDSSVIAKVAFIADPNSIAVTVISSAMPKEEIKNAKKMAVEIGITHKVVRGRQGEKFRRNDGNRCYHCKKQVMGIIRKVAREKGIQNVVDGSNCDDREEERPGMAACMEEGIISPLMGLRINKKEVRRIAKEMGLSNSSMASNTCLATRIPHGMRIREKTLRRIEKAEEHIKKLAGISVLRVRDSGDMAKIEVGKGEMKKLFKRGALDGIVRNMERLGYRHITLDLGERRDR